MQIIAQLPALLLTSNLGKIVGIFFLFHYLSEILQLGPREVQVTMQMHTFGGLSVVYTGPRSCTVYVRALDCYLSKYI